MEVNIFQVQHIYLICQRALCFLVSCDLLFVVTCFYYYMHLWNVCASTSRGHPTRLSWGILSESCLPILFPLSEQLSAQFAANVHQLTSLVGGYDWWLPPKNAAPQNIAKFKKEKNIGDKQ